MWFFLILTYLVAVVGGLALYQSFRGKYLQTLVLAFFAGVCDSMVFGATLQDIEAFGQHGIFFSSLLGGTLLLLAGLVVRAALLQKTENDKLAEELSYKRAELKELQKRFRR